MRFFDINICEIEQPDPECCFYDGSNPIIGLSGNVPGASSKGLSILIYRVSANYNTFPTSAINW